MNKIYLKHSIHCANCNWSGDKEELEKAEDNDCLLCPDCCATLVFDRSTKHPYFPHKLPAEFPF
jgi:hypothetical protein